MPSSSLWRWVAGIAMTALLASWGMWHATTQDFATRAEMHEAVKPDHDLIKETRDDVKDMSKRLDALSQEVGELKGLLASHRR